MSLPTEREIIESNKPRKEPTPFEKILRKLKTTGQIALLSTVLATACRSADTKPIPTSTIDTRPTATAPIIPTKETPATLPTATESAEPTKETINYERVLDVLNNFEKSYEAHQENGKPILLTQVENQYAQMDLDPIVKRDGYTSRQAWLEDQIFFLHDKKMLDQVLAAQKSDALTPEQKQAALDNLKYTFSVQPEIYAAVGSERGKQKNLDIKITAADQTQAQETAQIVRNAAESEGLLTDIEVDIVDNFSQGDLASEHFIVRPNPTMPIVAGSDLVYARHGLIHGQDILLNPPIIKSLNPEEAVTIMISQNAAVANLSEYSNVPPNISLERIRAVDSGAKLTDSQFKNLVNSAASTKFQEIFKIDQFLTSPTFTSVADTDDRTYNSFAQALTGEQQFIRQISSENKTWALIFEKMYQNPDLFATYFGTPNPNQENSNINLHRMAFYRTIEDQLAGRIIASALLKNDPGISLFTNEEKDQLEDSLIRAISATNSELLASGEVANVDLTKTGQYSDMLLTAHFSQIKALANSQSP